MQQITVLWPWLLPLAAAVGLAVVWVRQRRQAGRIAARLEFPEKLSPAAAGVLLSESVGTRHIAALIFDLARRGHLRISESQAPAALFTGRDFLFEQLIEHWNELDLKHYEVRVLNTIFGSGVRPSLSTLKTWKAFARSWPLMSQAIIDELIGLGYFASDPRRLRRYAGLAAGLLGIIAFLLAALGLWWSGRPVWMMSAAEAVAAMVPLCLAFMLLLSKRTAAGNRACAQVRGLRSYLRQASRHSPTPEDFGRYLPYAVALGETGKWIAAFRGRLSGGLPWFLDVADKSSGTDTAVLKRDIDHFNDFLCSALLMRLGRDGSRRHYLGAGPGAGHRPW